MKAAGLTPRGLSLKAGLSDTAVGRILDGRTPGPRADTIERLAIALGCTAADLVSGTTITPEAASAGASGSDPTVLIGSINAAKTPVLGERDLPVYASAEGGPTGMTITSDPIDFVRRPEPLLNVKQGFAVYIQGDSMSPAFEHGDMALVHPSKPARGGDDVLVIKRKLDGETDALIKRLVRRTEDAWQVKQYNPAREFELPRATWPIAYVIVGKYARR